MTSYYNQTAKGYNELHCEEQEKKLKIISSLIRPRSHHTLLDVGCGTGLSMQPWNCKKIGIDPNSQLLKQNPFRTKLAKAENLPFKPNSFDYVISVTAVHNFEDIEKGLKEIKRVAKSTIVLSILKKSPKFPKIESLISSIFKIKKIILEQRDIIFLLKK